MKKYYHNHKKQTNMTEKQSSQWKLSIRDENHHFSAKRAKQNWEKYHNGNKKLKEKINRIFGNDEELKKQLFSNIILIILTNYLFYTF